MIELYVCLALTLVAAGAVAGGLVTVVLGIRAEERSFRSEMAGIRRKAASGTRCVLGGAYNVPPALSRSAQWRDDSF